MAITPDGKTIYMPAGENSGTNLWYVEDAATGNDQTTIQTDRDPHDTVVSVNGSHVYMQGLCVLRRERKDDKKPLLW